MNKEPLVFGIIDDNLVLLPENVAKAFADDHAAIRNLKTFGEARLFQPQTNPVPGLDEEYLDEDEVPADDDPYYASLTPEFENGDWPPGAATIALDCLPEDLDDIGEQREPFPNSPYLFIDPATENELVETLNKRGYEVRRDDGLFERI